jgi:hypothetical protein
VSQRDALGGDLLSEGPELTLPGRLPAAVGRLELAGLDHAEAPARLRAESGDEVAGLGHAVHALRVDPVWLRDVVEPHRIFG